MIGISPFAAGSTFEEHQSFRQIWLWLILAGTAISTLIFIPKPFDYGQTSIIPIAAAVSVIGLFAVMSLHTRIDEIGIHYRFYPFHWRTQLVRWENIQHIEVCRYNPILEYGGWGVRYTVGNGRAYNVSGDMGIYIVLSNNKKILIGTIHPYEAAEVIKRYQIV